MYATGGHWVSGDSIPDVNASNGNQYYSNRGASGSGYPQHEPIMSELGMIHKFIKTPIACQRDLIFS